MSASREFGLALAGRDTYATETSMALIHVGSSQMEQPEGLAGGEAFHWQIPQQYHSLLAYYNAQLPPYRHPQQDTVLFGRTGRALLQIPASSRGSRVSW